MLGAAEQQYAAPVRAVAPQNQVRLAGGAFVASPRIRQSMLSAMSLADSEPLEAPTNARSQIIIREPAGPSNCE
jgi:hypothetical protein